MRNPLSPLHEPWDNLTFCFFPKIIQVVGSILNRSHICAGAGVVGSRLVQPALLMSYLLCGYGIGVGEGL